MMQKTGKYDISARNGLIKGKQQKKSQEFLQILTQKLSYVSFTSSSISP